MTWIYLAALLYGLTATLVVLTFLDTAPIQRRTILRRIGGPAEAAEVEQGLRARWAQLVQLVVDLLQRVGERRAAKEGVTSLDELLLQAGYRHPQRVAILRGSRFVAAIGVAVVVLSALLLFGASPGQAIPMALYSSLVGLLIPRWYVRHRRTTRQAELQRALPDMLDLLVVCTESGLGLNQALVKVADEMEPISRAMRDELLRTNAEIRAGVPRDDALRHLEQRSAVEDIRTLVNVLIQTNRFGTPVAQALRQQSSAMRRRVRQRMEEEAGKMAVRLLFPMVLFIFPPLVVVVLGPAVLHLLEALAEMQ